VNGDLFDSFSVPMSDVLGAYHAFAEWLSVSEGDLVLGRGNHDLAKNSANLSSFDFLGHVLQAQFPERVQVVTEPTTIFPGIHMVPHAPNQDIFDLWLKEVGEEAGNSLILVHANYDNDFAAESVHSLNVSRQQAEWLTQRGNTLIFGHEHQARRELGGRVVITGNQWPSSIADCLHNPDGLKHAYVLSPIAPSPADARWSMRPVCTWDAREYYQDVPWDEMLNQSVDQDPHFVRVCGRATTEQAGDVIAAISKYRAKSPAFVVGNDVKIAGVSDMTDLPTVEDVRKFDVMGYLLEQLDPEQRKVIEDLYATAEMREAA
jgi:hypothetical protein